MALKAGRVGVATDQVDEFGQIISEATSGYTKQEADAKFLTQTDAASTYESKSDASTAHNVLQPKTLAVPIELLSGSVLTTVEQALSGLDHALSNSDLTQKVSVSDGVITVSKGTDNNSTLKKQNSVVYANIRLNDVTAAATDVLAILPEGFRPVSSINAVMFDITNSNMRRGYVDSDGTFRCDSNITASNIRCYFVYII